MPRSITVNAVSPDELPDACAALAANRAPDRRAAQAHAYLTALAAGTIDLAGFLAARDSSGAVRGAILAQVLDGAVGLVWPPGVSSDREREAIEEPLVSSALAWLRAAGVKVAQSLPTAGDRDGMAALERHGFRLVTRLSLWDCDLTNAHHVARPCDSLSFIPWDASDECTATLLATYEGSLDCPESSGDRTPAELAAGHGRVPDSNEPLWFLARQAGEAVGVVLLAQAAPHGGELTYLGLRPEARGRGLGRELLRFAIARSVELGFHNLTLSVDVRNEPALQLYRAHGFRVFERRDVYNRVLSAGTNFF